MTILTYLIWEFKHRHFPDDFDQNDLHAPDKPLPWAAIAFLHKSSHAFTTLSPNAVA